MQLVEGFCSRAWMLCSHPIPYHRGFPRPCGGVVFVPCCSGGRFSEQSEIPQPNRIGAIQFNVLFIDKVEGGAVGKVGG